MNGNRRDPTEIEMLLLELVLLRALERDLHLPHSHTCTQCNTSWQHTGRAAGIQQEHMCPQCNTGPYWERT